MKQKDPAFLLYSSDFLTGTAFMSDEEVGQYTRLLCLQHQHGHLMPEQLSGICRGNPTALILSKFKLDSDGKYYNQRLDIEIDKRKGYSLEQKRKADIRWGNTKDAAAMPGQCLSSSSSSSSSIPLPLSKKEYSPSFLEFWKRYPKKVGKGAAARAWSKLVSPAETLTLIIMRLDWQTKTKQWTGDNGQFIPHPATYLNERRWEDEPPEEDESRPGDSFKKDAFPHY